MRSGIAIPLALALSLGMTTSGWAAPTALSATADATKYVVQVDGMT